MSLPVMRGQELTAANCKSEVIWTARREEQDTRAGREEQVAQGPAALGGDASGGEGAAGTNY